MKGNNHKPTGSVFSLIKITLAIIALVNLFQGDATISDYGILIGCGTAVVFEIVEKVAGHGGDSPVS